MTAFCIPYSKSAFPLIFLFAVFFCVVPIIYSNGRTNLLLLFVGEINPRMKERRCHFIRSSCCRGPFAGLSASTSFHTSRTLDGCRTRLLLVRLGNGTSLQRRNPSEGAYTSTLFMYVKQHTTLRFSANSNTEAELVHRETNAVKEQTVTTRLQHSLFTVALVITGCVWVYCSLLWLAPPIDHEVTTGSKLAVLIPVICCICFK